MYGNAVSNQTLNVLNRPGVSKKTGKSRSSIYNAINPASKYYDESFPKPIRTGAKSIGWIESEVDAWIASRAQARNA
ncbi:helix-turn-helix transcriptional regulator [Burkholderia thailandensis]|uniref:helix-turn-helix transcriptional regulator n=1 Tax=Burkholderia thailandensis TaxID=57975 RepID=UPI003B512BE9